MKKFKVDIPDVWTLSFECEEIAENNVYTLYRNVNIKTAVLAGPAGRCADMSLFITKNLSDYPTILVTKKASNWLSGYGYCYALYFGHNAKRALLTKHVPELIENVAKVTSDWNTTCPHCGAPAYQGFMSVECSRRCQDGSDN